jgi:hypothetical protein
MKTQSPKREAGLPKPAPCANEGCPRPAPPGESYCETCDLDRSLFQRDLRAVRRSAEAR